jgi:hypothetical protein
MSFTGLDRIIAGLECGDATAVQDALAVLHVLARVEVVPGFGVEEYSEELERLTHSVLAFQCACAQAQCRLALDRARHYRAELEQLRESNRDLPTLPSPRDEAPNEPTIPSPPPPGPESADGA